MNVKVAYKFVPKFIYDRYIRHIDVYHGSKTDMSYGCVQLIPEKFLYASFIYKNLEEDKNKFKLIKIDLNKSNSVKLGRFNGLYYPITCREIYTNVSIISVIDMDNYLFKK